MEVIDHGERQSARVGQSLRCRHTNQERTDQARPLGHGDALDVVETNACLLERSVYNTIDRSDVVPRGDFGHHAAVLRMDLRLRRHHGGQNGPPLNDRGGRLVAGRFDCEDHGILRHQSGAPLRHMINASSRLSE